MLILTALVQLLLLTSTAHAQAAAKAAPVTNPNAVPATAAAPAPKKAAHKAAPHKAAHPKAAPHKATPRAAPKPLPKSMSGNPLNNTHTLTHAVGEPLSVPAPAGVVPNSRAACIIDLTNDELQLSCDGDTLVIANIDPAFVRMGITIKPIGDNLNLSSTGCPTADVNPVPLISLCSAAATFSVENSSIAGFTAPLSRPQRPVLGLMGSGMVQVDNLRAEDVQGGTAVHAHGHNTVVVKNSVFERNSARESIAGALLVTTAVHALATVHLTANTFSHNSAGAAGAAAIMLQSNDAISVLINGVNTFSNNTALATGAGALLINATDSTRSNIVLAEETEFLSNLCWAGGGGASILLEGAHGSNVTVAGGTFDGNVARNDDTVPASGGGLYIAAARAKGIEITLKGRGEFHANSASRSGGGLYVNLTDSDAASVLLGGAYEFVRNKAKYEGGGSKIDFSGAKTPRAVVRGAARFVGNAAQAGGGLYVDFTLTTTPVMEIFGEVVFNRNSAAQVAGGMMVDVGSVPVNATLTILGNATFTANDAAGPLGGGLVFAAPGATSPHIKVRGDVLFEANTANVSGGFAFMLRGSEGAVVDLGPRGIYGNNKVLRSGAAVGVDITNSSGAVVVLRGSYQGNSGEHKGGACAVWADQSTKARIEMAGSSSWEDNRASLGGGVWVTALHSREVKVVVMEAARFSGNQAFFGAGLYVTAEASVQPNILFSGSCQFRNNTSGGGQGGGAYVRISHCGKPTLRVLQNAAFVDNAAASYSAGGGLFVNASFSSAPGILISDDALFGENLAHWGGGLDLRLRRAMAPKVRMLGAVLFRGNNATEGAGVHMDISLATDALIQVDVAVKFANNTASRGGGMLIAGDAVMSPLLSFEGSVEFSGNAASEVGGGLAVLLPDSNEVTVSFKDKVAFIGNSAGSGGGLYWDAQHSNLATFAATGDTKFVENNATTGAGGGAMLMWEDTSTATVRLVGAPAFQANWAATNGGGLAIASRTVVHLDLDVEGRAAFDANMAAGGAGGGLYLDATEAAVVNVTVAGRTQYIGNSAVAGGGFYFNVRDSERAMVQVTGNGTVTKGNRARLGGGGGFIDISGTNEGSSLALSGGIWQFNSADRGGALCVYANSSNTSVAVTDGDFLNNEAVSGAGGALYFQLGPVSTGIQGQSQVQVKECHFAGNVVRSGPGGAVYAEGSSAALDGCARGLDVSIFGLPPGEPCPPSFTFDACFFEGNNATLGGGLYVINTQAVVASTQFIKNRGSKLGGAMYVKKMQSMQIGPMVTIQGNSAAKQGGGIYATVSDDLSANRLAITQTIVFNNGAGTQGGGLFIQGGPTVMNDTNIANNTARRAGGGVAYYNICDEQDCALRLQLGTQILDNKAPTGAAVYLANGDKGVDSAELVSATSMDGTMTAQSAGVSSAPTLLRAEQEEFMVASSTGDTGRVDLLVELGKQDGARVQVDMCDSEDEATQDEEAVLMGTRAKTIGGVAHFTLLRILKGTVGKRYCLKVTAPDYEEVIPIRVFVTIRDCIAGEVKADLGCAACPANQFSFAYSPAATCRPCAHNARCAGGNTFVPKCGFWHANTTSTSLLACPNREACCGSRAALQGCQRTHTCPAGAGYMAKQCSAGYRGPLCGSCDRARGYGASGFLRCTKCVSPFGTAALIFFAMTIVAALIAYMANTAVHEAQRNVRPEALQSFRKHVDRSEDGANNALLAAKDVDRAAAAGAGGAAASVRALTARVGASLAEREILEATAVFKLLVVHLQYLVLLGSLLVDWPDVVTGFISALKLFVLYSVDNARVLSLECLGVGGNGGRMLLALLLPLLAVALAASLGALWRSRESARKSQARRLADDRITITDMIVACAVVGGSLIYANLLTTSLSAFSCVRIGSTLHWARDVDVVCWSSAHLSSSLLWGLLGLLLLCVLAPAAVITSIARHQASVEANTALKPAPSEKQFSRRFGFLYRLYRPEYCFWEGIVCMQTVILVFISLYGRQAGVYYQVLLDLLVLGASTTLVRVLRPFRTRALQRLYLSGCSALLLTCVGALALLWEQRIEDGIDGTSLRGFMAFLVLSLNLGYVLWCAYEIWRAVKDATLKKVKVAKEWWGWMKGGRVGSFRPATSIAPLAAGGGVPGVEAAAGAAEGLWVDNLQRIRQLQLQAQDIETTRLRSTELGSSAMLLPTSSVASISFQYED